MLRQRDSTSFGSYAIHSHERTWKAQSLEQRLWMKVWLWMKESILWMCAFHPRRFKDFQPKGKFGKILSIVKPVPLKILSGTPWFSRFHPATLLSKELNAFVQSHTSVSRLKDRAQSKSVVRHNRTPSSVWRHDWCENCCREIYKNRIFLELEKKSLNCVEQILSRRYRVKARHAFVGLDFFRNQFRTWFMEKN
jgi:hypothetical protein